MHNAAAPPTYRASHAAFIINVKYSHREFYAQPTREGEMAKY